MATTAFSRVNGASTKRPSGLSVRSRDHNGASTLIEDRRGGHTYTKGRLLGKGGFAKCYELTDVQTQRLYAGKIVEKKTLVKYRAKEKLKTEIKIHNALFHDHIVGFHRFFEDSDCVYILLEVCTSQTMMELHKRRRTLTEPETRYYLKQIIDGTKYMHGRKVIHRDLKLGNLFLDKDLNVKIGDFGLATTVEYEGERKKTLCGTPNYIAPEILDRKCGGHSYEVDVWSIGCILYTLLVGRPPFETSNIDSTYRKIKTNDYHIPSSANISKAAQDLIRWSLAAKPSNRPSLDEMLAHSFLNDYTPATLPRSSLTKVPSFSESTSTMAKPSALRRPLGSVDVNSPSTFQKSGKAIKTKVVADRQFPTRAVTSEARHSLASVQESLQQLVKQQSDATNVVCPVPVDVNVASTSIWISKWVDYSNKYGLGYQLSDGSVGVLFNDSTKMVLSSDQAKIESIERSSRGYMVTHLTLTEYPPNLTKKVTLLKYFKSYMNEHLLNGGDGDADAKLAESADMMHVKKWLRTKHAIVFRLSQGVIQINFFDHAKLVLNTSLGLITFIDKSRKTNTYNVKDIAATATTDEVVADLIGRLPYAVEVVEMMMKPSSH